MGTPFIPKARKLREIGLSSINGGRRTTRSPRPQDLESLIIIGIMIAKHESPDGTEADPIIERLLPEADNLPATVTSALCELLALRDRDAEANRLSRRLDPITHMLTQMRCLAPRLVRAAQTHAHDLKSMIIVLEGLLAEPILALEDLVKTSPERGLIEAQAALNGKRLMIRALHLASLRAPIIGFVYHHITKVEDETPEELLAIEAAGHQMAIEMGRNVHSIIDDPTPLQEEIDRLIEEAMGSEAPDRSIAPHTGSDPIATVSALRDALYGQQAA